MSANSLSICGGNLSGPMTLHIFSLVTFSLIWSSSMANVLFVPNFSSVFWGLGFLMVSFTGKDQGKKATEYLSLFHGLCHQCLCPSQYGHTSSLVFLLLFMHLWSLFLLPFTSRNLGRLNSRWAWPFLMLYLARLDRNSITLLGHLPSFYLLATSFLCLSSFRSSLLIHGGLCSISYMLRWTFLKFGEDGPWISTNSHAALFSPGQYSCFILFFSSKQIAEEAKSDLLKSRAVVLVFALIPPLRVLTFKISWSLQPRMTSTFLSATSSS